MVERSPVIACTVVMHHQIDAGTASNITSIVGRQRRRAVDRNIISRNWSAAVEERLSVSDTDGAFVGRETVVTAAPAESNVARYASIVTATCGLKVATSEVDRAFNAFFIGNNIEVDPNI